MRTLFAVLYLLSALFPVAAGAQPAELAGIGSYIEQGMAEWGIPGLAVAVVRGEEVLYARGFGVRELGHPEAVDEHTLFGVASTTKAMTATALGLLVERGLLSWDDRVVDHMPEFRLSDPWVTAHVTVRDLLSHRVGVGRMTGNRIQFMTHRPRPEIIYRMRYHDFEQPFRQGYVYSNVMYSVAGELIPAVDGRSWDRFMMEELFAPLGMHRSNTSITMIGDGENAAWPHQEIEGRVVPIPRRNFDNVGPSASVNTSVSEMARWIGLQLGEAGVIDGRRIVSRQVIAETHQAQNVIRTADPYGGLRSYGFGWSLGDHRGYRTSQHGGASDGMNTMLLLVHDADIGVIVMTNTFNNFMNALASEIVDRMLGYEDVDWNARYRQLADSRRAVAESRRRQIHDARLSGTRPTHDLSDYTGRFQSDLYDEVEVRMENGRLMIEFWDDPTLRADLEHWHLDTFRAVWRNPAQREEFLQFTTSRHGRVDGLEFEFVLRPLHLQTGVYPSDYTRVVRFERQ
jgi:CubicO group peptidase (beta-lactamase class C family)